jgi:uncharacterized protein YidB (DUF937 family)
LSDVRISPRGRRRTGRRFGIEQRSAARRFARSIPEALDAAKPTGENVPST